MKRHNLLSAKAGHEKTQHNYTGKVITLKPDTRWCSDGFEIRCWNREVVLVAFSLDCCDREVISWNADRYANAAPGRSRHPLLCLFISGLMDLLVYEYNGIVDSPDGESAPVRRASSP